MKLGRALTGLAILAVAVHAQTNNAITSVRTWSQPEVTRIIVEFSGAVQYKHERLAGPPRIFFDIPNAGLNLVSAPGKHFSTTQVNDGLVTRVRLAESQPGSARLVFDLASEKVDYAISELENPTRLVVEFRSGTGKGGIKATKPEPPPAPRITVDQMRSEAKIATATGKIAKPPASVPGALTPDPIGQIPEKELPTPVRETTKPKSSKPDASSKDVGSAQPARLSSRSMTRALGLKLGKIVLDPGHGGHDFGTSSPNGDLHEKELVLDVAKRLGAILEDRLGSEVVYTRTDDTFIPLEKRTEFANAQKADLFVSIHANSSRYPKVSGPETFFLNFNASNDAMDVAARENASSGKTIFELQDLVKKIALNEKLTESREFASKVQASMDAISNVSRDRGVKRAPFVVLIGAAMPSILTEIGFVTNPRECALLKKPEYRQKVAEALYRGISKYAGSLSHFQVAARSGADSSGADTR